MCNKNRAKEYYKNNRDVIFIYLFIYLLIIIFRRIQLLVHILIQID